jgi:hypothetical protein
MICETVFSNVFLLSSAAACPVFFLATTLRAGFTALALNASILNLA